MKSKERILQKVVDRIDGDLKHRYKSPKELETKKKSLIHQIWGAYYSSKPNFGKILRNISKSDSDTYLANLMQVHSSTKERLPIYSEFYKDVFKITKTPKSILDLGCGLNPIFFVLNKSLHGIRSEFVDIDEEEIRFLNDLFEYSHCDNFHAVSDDAISFDYSQTADFDLVLMLKLLPVIEQQSRGMSEKILRQIKSKHVVISFPTKSIGGRGKNMETNYTTWFKSLVSGLGWSFETITYPNEVVFVCTIPR